MDPLSFILQSIAGMTFFTSRPFMTTFGIALLGRWALTNGDTPVRMHMNLAGIDTFVQEGVGIPWLLSDTVLLVFGVLMLLEIGANASQDLRWYYDRLLGWFQPGNAFIVTFSIGDWQYTAWIEMVGQLLPLWSQTIQLTGLGGYGVALGAGIGAGEPVLASSLLATLGHGFTIGWALLIALVTWLLGRLRASVMDTLYEFDEDDSLGIQGFLRWAETGWSAVGVYVLVFLPLIALVVFVLTLGGLLVVRKLFERQEQRALVPCPSCDTRIHPSAPHCPQCKSAQTSLRQVGLFGQATLKPAPEPATHRVQLIGRKRCPFCATRLKQRAVRQACSACGTVTFADIAELNSYLRALDQKLTRTVAICFVLGLVPLAGLVPGIVYYRMSLIASLRSYVPASVGCLTRWGINIVGLFLIMLQSIPVIGVVTLPALCLLNYSVYRQVLRSISASSLQRAFDPVPASTGSVSSAGLATMTLTPATSAATEAGLSCTRCGTAMREGERFCGGCGQIRPTS